MSQGLGDDVVYAPSVYLVGQTKLVVDSADKLDLDDFLLKFATGYLEYIAENENVNEETLVEIAGRLCYNSFSASSRRPGGNEAYIQRLLECGHGSVLEHAVFSFIITGVSRSLTHELVRHRVGVAYSQESERYVGKHAACFVIPPAIIGNEALSHTWYVMVKDARMAYSKICEELQLKYVSVPDLTLRLKKAREAARSVLPECTETRIFVTMNARELRHFLTLRGSLQADAEIRRLAVVIFRVVQQETPNLFQGIEVANSEESEEYLINRYPKV